MNRREFLIFGATTLITTNSFGLELTKKNRDVFVPNEYKESLYQLHKRLENIEKTIGYANFNLLSFDEALKIASLHKNIGSFTKKELELVEYFFYTPAEKFGFLGERTINRLTAHINKKNVVKIPHTGHFLFKGESLKVYNKLMKDVNDIYLTSGIRSVVKQLRLFVRKIYNCNYNISKAAFSIAPPGYSYHSISDFDVGKKGWGYANFTSKFAKTEQFYKIRHLNYVGIRYRKDNIYGVRFEPWHIKVI